MTLNEEELVELFRDLPPDVRDAATAAADAAVKALMAGWNPMEYASRVVSQAFREAGARGLNDDEPIERCRAAGFYPPEEIMESTYEETYIEHVLDHYGYLKTAERDEIYWGRPTQTERGES